MKNNIFYLLSCLLFMSCGSGCFLFEDCNEESIYTYLIRNETGTTAIIKVGNNQQEVIQNEMFECSYSETFNSGLCQGFLEIRFPSNGKGYRCEIGIPDEGLCFEDESSVFFSSNENSIFQEISPRTYEYVLTPDLLENAFVLPD